MPHHHELHEDVSQGPEPRPRHRRDQEAAGRYSDEGGAGAQGDRNHHTGVRVNRSSSPQRQLDTELNTKSSFIIVLEG